MSENEIDLQKWKERIHTSATEDENATDDRQRKEKQDLESDDHQSAQTGHDRVDVRNYDRTNDRTNYSTNFDCQFKTELENETDFIKIQNVNDVLFFSRVTCGSKEQ